VGRDDEEDQGDVGWRLTIAGAHIDDRLTSDGVVGVVQPLVLIEPSEGMTEDDETEQWRLFMAACGRDALTGDRLLLVRIERSHDDEPSQLEFRHIVTTHAFDVPEGERPAVEKISRLASIPVIYKFRFRTELVYRGVIEDPADADFVPNLEGDGPELWISRFGRSSRPNPHVNAMNPVSRNLVGGTSSADVFVVDLASFKMPAKPDCVFCALPLANDETNREHIVPDWVRRVTSDQLGVPIDGVVATAHSACNDAHNRSEDVVRQLTSRHLAGEHLSDDELAAVAFWMAGRMTLLDRAAGIEPPKQSPLDWSFHSAPVVLPPQYFGRLGDDAHPRFKTLVLGPWIYHCCWSEDGCAEPDA
jgi:hypothetical protein